MTELCRLGSSVGRAFVRSTRDPWFESRPSSTLFCHRGGMCYGKVGGGIWCGVLGWSVVYGVVC